MGNCLFNKKNIRGRIYDENYVLMNTRKNTKRKANTQVLVSHYTPSTFPAPPILTKQNNELCCKSWDQITTPLPTKPAIV
jgi:hypothetical protein